MHTSVALSHTHFYDYYVGGIRQTNPTIGFSPLCQHHVSLLHANDEVEIETENSCQDSYSDTLSSDAREAVSYERETLPIIVISWAYIAPSDATP